MSNSLYVERILAINVSDSYVQKPKRQFESSLGFGFLHLKPLKVPFYSSSDSYSQRAGVRAALSQDPSWISEYISKAIPMLVSQDNEVNYLVPWSHLHEPPKEGGKPRPHTVTAKHSLDDITPMTPAGFQVCMSWRPSRCALVVQRFGETPSRLLSPPMMHLGMASLWELSTASVGC